MTDEHYNSSSSDDEATKEALKEATDQDFLKNSMFETENTKKKHGHGSKGRKNKPKRSLRMNPQRADNFHSFGVSQSYKDFVAKKLTEILDNDIEIEEVKYAESTKHEEDIEEIGVKLLKASNNIITGDEEEIIVDNAKKRKLQKSEPTKDDILKCKEAAVDPETILSKIETEAWDEKQKGTVFKYKKLADGTLVQQ